MRRIALLGLTLLLPACQDYVGSPLVGGGGFLGDTMNVRLNPNAPLGNAPNMLRAEGRQVQQPALTPEPGMSGPARWRRSPRCRTSSASRTWNRTNPLQPPAPRPMPRGSSTPPGPPPALPPLSAPQAAPPASALPPGRRPRQGLPDAPRTGRRHAERQRRADLHRPPGRHRHRGAERQRHQHADRAERHRHDVPNPR